MASPVKSLYVIYSSLSLDHIHDNFLPLFGEESGIGLMKVETFKGKETNRALAFLSDEIFSNLEKAGFTQLARDRPSSSRQVDFRVAPFHLRDMDMPKDGQGPNLYLPLDNKWTSTEYYKYFDEIFDSLVSFGVLSAGDYLYSIPLKTRNEDIHKGSCFIKFKTTVSVETIACIRTFLYGYEGLKCFWAKPVESSEKATSKPATKGKQGKKHPLAEAISKVDTSKDKKELGAMLDKFLTEFENFKKNNKNKKITLKSALETFINSSDFPDKEAGKIFIDLVMKHAADKKAKERKEKLKNNFVAVESVTSNEWGV